MGDAKYVLGIKITCYRPNRLLTLPQESYLENILIRFDMMAYKTMGTPIYKSVKLSNNQGPTNKQNKAMMKKKKKKGGLMLKLWEASCMRCCA